MTPHDATAYHCGGFPKYHWPSDYEVPEVQFATLGLRSLPLSIGSESRADFVSGRQRWTGTTLAVPPRAQYFVVVGGLACCKDDLGCAR